MADERGTFPDEYVHVEPQARKGAPPRQATAENVHVGEPQDRAGMPHHRVHAENVHAGEPRMRFSTATFLLAIVAVGAGIFHQMWSSNREKAREFEKLQEQQRKMEEKMEEEERDHRIAMTKPSSDLLSVVQPVLESRLDYQRVLNALDREKIQIHTGAWKIRTTTAFLEESLRAKLQAKGLPEPVVESIVKSLMHDKEIVISERDFAVDGRTGQGHVYHVRVRGNHSKGEAAIALMVSSSSFDMHKVVDSYETHQEPVYEQVQVRNLVRKVECVSEDTLGRNCIFPFRYNGRTFHSCTTNSWGSLWCATSTDHFGDMYNWGYCGTSQSCQPDQYETTYQKKFVRMAEKKFPVYSHKALPDGITQSDVALALDMEASHEALRVLKA